jgi:glucosyl-3-phosphoglycerate synthase
VRAELVVYLDSDTRDFSPHFATGMLGPLMSHPDVSFVKGFFRRPYLRPDGSEAPAEGGRVTELMARPLLSAFYPELAAFAQPLAGEVAARRSLLERIPFATGYAVETAMLLHARDALGGTGAMAQVDLDVRLNRHQPLSELGPMAHSVLRVVLDRLRAEGRLTGDEAPALQTADGGLVHVDVVERPPFATLHARA